MMQESQESRGNTAEFIRAQFQDILNKAVMFPDTATIERGIISACINSPAIVHGITSKLTDECFSDSNMKTIYVAISEMTKAGIAIDLATLSYRLRVSGMMGGSLSYDTLVTLSSASEPATVQQIASYISILKEVLALKRLHASIRIACSGIEKTADVFEVSKSLKSALSEIVLSVSKTSLYDSSELYALIVSDLLELSEKGTTVAGIRNRHINLQKKIPVWQAGDLIIVAGRPGMGKTSFVQNILKDTADDGKIGIFFSLEMPAIQIMYRILSGLTADGVQYSAKDLRASGINPNSYISTTIIPELKNRYNEIFAGLLYIDDSPKISTSHIRATIQEIKNSNINEVGAIVIDYLQLMSDDGANNKDAKTDRIGFITSDCKAIAKEFGVPVFLLSQLNREVEKRPNKEPQLSDLRASGDIEQDADNVIFLLRPEYYNISSWICAETGNEISTAGYGEFIIAKYRGGKIGRSGFEFLEKCTTIK